MMWEAWLHRGGSPWIGGFTSIWGIWKGFDSICPERWGQELFYLWIGVGWGEQGEKDILAEQAVLCVGSWRERDRAMCSLID